MKRNVLVEIFYKLFDDPFNGQVCKWTAYWGIGFFVVRGSISLIFGI